MSAILNQLNLARAQFVGLPHPARAMCGIALAAAAILLAFVLIWLLSWWLATATQIKALEPRIAQTLGFIESEERVYAALAERDDLLLKMALPDTGDSGRGGAVLQERVRDLSTDSGLSVIGSEVLEPQALDNVIKLRLSAKVAGSPEAVTAFFLLLDEARPFLFVDSFTISAKARVPERDRRSGSLAEESLMLDLTLYAYQMVPE